MGEYVDAGGLKMWVDSWGSGPSLVLLHGGMVSNQTWEPMVPGLAEHFHIVAPERRGHGHTPDVDGPYSYALMAEDMIALLDEVVGAPVHVVGWSDGGNIGLRIAVKRPDLVRKLVAISAHFDSASDEAGMSEALAASTGQEPENAFPRGLYEATSPDGPGHWPIFFEKCKRMILDPDQRITAEERGRITLPTLIIAADDDLVRMEHTVELYRSIPNSQLAIVPGTSHVLVMEKPAEVDRQILDFLQKDPGPTMWPIHRAS
jgi:pimeloyl-ACP methyl ester carboxylesterase